MRKPISSVLPGWRRPAFFLRLALGSVIGFFAFAVVHNFLDAVAGSEPASFPAAALRFVSAAAFLAAVLLCPIGLIIGLVGAAVTFFRRNRP